ncbi:hypothetical protein [Stratiformator vulcanicus]|uniref:Uncharacterized protein n=1 Tax=Stratiformator vulcanicus TaxID=2527980 RepID=A0A517QZ69_9PLAN|nr:hypothetical protein [Stratiformator vulcanicus]QDT36939.1 hypothetical protein Pan189_13030 [Stratiformator vulcanicus]
MKRLALAMLGLAVSAISTGCCCLSGGGGCGPCGGGAYYGPTPGVVAPGGCPNGNCGIGAAAPGYGISQASVIPTNANAQFASAAPAYTPVSASTGPIATTSAQPTSGPVIMQAGGFQTGPQFTQAAPGIRMNPLPTY